MTSTPKAVTTRIQLRAPYLIFFGDIEDHGMAKTGLGLQQWCPDKCLAQLRLPGCSVDAGLPEMDVQTAAAQGAKSLLLGVAPVGGQIKESWIATMVEAARAGLDIVAGMHTRLGSVPGLAAAAQAGGGKLIDVRVPPAGIPIASGRKRKGMRLLAVGTDCAVGKKYTALAISQELVRRGVKATFRATGQTGIMIAGEGMPIDTVVCDFTAGAAEVLSPDNAPDHWDVIEGQGSLFHPAYAGVSLGLLHGSQPDAIVVCHDARRTEHLGHAGYALPSVPDCIALNLQLARRTNPAVRCVGVAVNTRELGAAERKRYLESMSAQVGLPCVDPIAGGPGAIVDELLKPNAAATGGAR